MTQHEALDILKMGRNVFLTGPAGSGKTYLLNSYIQYLRKMRTRVAVTASTGIAATHLNGRTVHSWSGIGVKDALTKRELKKLLSNTKVKTRVRETNILIIDEISMLDAQRLDLVDEICRSIRADQSPFGGIQVIVSGDFFQLPPVAERQGNNEPNFAFRSKVWKSGAFTVCYLEQQYRQQDTQYCDVLNNIRNSEHMDVARELLMARVDASIAGIAKPTKLFSHNADVDIINDVELSHIQSPEQTYAMQSAGAGRFVEPLKKHCLAPAVLTLKVGALVMFVTNNFHEGYVNGTFGEVIGFDDDNGYPIVRIRSGQHIIATPASWEYEEDGTTLGKITQVPLRLAWAITIHKSQGMSLDCAEIDLSKAFTEGMGYVALSRVRTLDGIKLIGVNDMALRVHEKIRAFDQDLRKRSQQTQQEIRALNKSLMKKLQKSFFDKIG